MRPDHGGLVLGLGPYHKVRLVGVEVVVVVPGPSVGMVVHVLLSRRVLMGENEGKVASLGSYIQGARIQKRVVT